MKRLFVYHSINTGMCEYYSTVFQVSSKWEPRAPRLP
jgi:hypothetical protein